MTLSGGASAVKEPGRGVARSKTVGWTCPPQSTPWRRPWSEVISRPENSPARSLF